MRFQLIDRITELVPNQKIVAIKNLAMSEEYLMDHFPQFPVMPGVLMLEAMTQAAAWLIRVSEDFAHSVVLLKEARNIKYGSFVEPGSGLVVTCEVIDQDERLTRFKTQGMIDGQPALSARLNLERFNLREARPDWADVDADLIRDMKKRLGLVLRGEPTPAAT